MQKYTCLVITELVWGIYYIIMTFRNLLVVSNKKNNNSIRAFECVKSKTENHVYIHDFVRNFEG